jgi:type II secretion system protein I
VNRTQRGFTLLEVLIATSIAAVGIVAVLELFAGSTRLAGNSSEQTLAISVARSVMDQALWQGDLDSQSLSGEFDKYRWSLTVEPVEPQLGSGEEEERPNESQDYELKRIVVTVDWPSLGGREKSLTLESARIMEAF